MRSLKLILHSTINQLHYHVHRPTLCQILQFTPHYTSPLIPVPQLLSRNIMLTSVKWTTYCYSLAAITYHYKVLPSDLISHTQKLVLKVKAFHASPLLYTPEAMKRLSHDTG
jgi:hypothetical protein